MSAELERDDVAGVGVQDGQELLDAKGVLAVLLGRVDAQLAARVRAVLEYAVTTDLYEAGAMSESDPVLSMLLDRQFTRGELLEVLESEPMREAK